MGEYGFAPQKLKTSSKFHNDPKNQRKPEPGELIRSVVKLFKFFY